MGKGNLFVLRLFTQNAQIQLWWQNVELLNVKLMVLIVTTVRYIL